MRISGVLPDFEMQGNALSPWTALARSYMSVKAEVYSAAASLICFAEKRGAMFRMKSSGVIESAIAALTKVIPS